MKCKYNNGMFECQKKAWQNTDFCVLHLDLPKEILERFSAEFYQLIQLLECKRLKIQHTIQNSEFDLTGAKIIELDFQGIESQEDLLFMDSKIYGKVDLSSSNIFGGIFLNSAELYESFFCKNTSIHGDVELNGCVFHKNVVFNESNIEGKFDLIATKFKDIFVFRGGKIGSYLHFTPSEVLDFVDFGFTSINGSALFMGTNFQKHSRFDGLKVKDDVFFNHISFMGDVYFNRAIFEANVYFSNRRDYFSIAINPYDNEKKTKINEIFNSSCEFKEVSFLGKGLFEGLNSFEANFEGSRLRNVKFRDCNLLDVRFKDVSFENCEISASINEDGYIIPEERDYIGDGIDAEIVADTYRRIRQSLQGQGAYDKAGVFYIKEMEMKKQIYKNTKPTKWFFYQFLYILCEYGENPLRLFSLLLYYIGLYSIILVKISSNLIIPLGSGGLGLFSALFVYVFARKMAR